MKYIDAIVGKLQAHGLTKANFTHDRAKEILSHCVAANKMIKVFEEFSLHIFLRL